MQEKVNVTLLGTRMLQSPPAASVTVPAPCWGNAKWPPAAIPPQETHLQVGFTKAKHSSICFVTILPTRPFHPSPKAATPRGFSQSQERHRKERCSASLILHHDLPHSASCDGMLGVPASSPYTKDHSIERSSPVLNKTFHCLSAVLLSHLYSSAQYFRFLLLCWFCFLTQTTRLKNGPAATSCEKGDLLRQ